MPDLIVHAAAVEEGKPSPVPYLQAAARLGAEPEDCLVIEDAPSGVQSGLHAGMTVWGVNATVPVEGVHRHFVSLREAVPHILAFALCGSALTALPAHAAETGVEIKKVSVNVARASSSGSPGRSRSPSR